MNREMNILIEQGPEPVIRAFTAASSYVRGRRVVVEDGHSVIRGTTDGLDEVGFLWLRHDNGTSDTYTCRRSTAGSMLLALDVGNSNITIGVFDGSRLVRHWRLRTVHDQTSDEWGILLRNLFNLGDLTLEDVHGIIVASVVPPLDSTLASMSRRYFHREAFFVTSDTTAA